MSSAAEKKQYIREFFEKYAPYVNLSSVALQVRFKKTKDKVWKSTVEIWTISFIEKYTNNLLEKLSN